MSPKGRKDAEEGIQSEGRKLLRDWFDGKLDGTKRPRSKLAELLQVSEPAIGYWLKGTSRPELHYRAAIEAICGIPAASWELAEERAKLAEALERLAEERKCEELLPPETNEPTPPEVPEAKRNSSRPPGAAPELVDAVDLDSEGTPTDVNVEPLPPVTTEGRSQREREATDPQDTAKIEKPTPLHRQAHPELGNGDGKRRSQRDREESPR